MLKKTALITGITGMDGSYLAELLLEKGYKIYGVKRRTSGEGYGNVEHLLGDIELIEGDLLDQISLNSIVKMVKPDECYNLAAMSHVGTSFAQPLYTADCTGLGVLRLLEAIKEFSGHTKFYNAATSELFGGMQTTACNEQTAFYPRSPYGIAKLFGYWTTVNYREAYKIFACNGILFNHSSPRRGVNFATRKITKTAARIKLGLEKTLTMGNIDTFRDEGHSKDYMEAAWLMLQKEKSDNYVISTGETHSIREMVEFVFKYLNLEINDHLVIDPKLYRPSEVNVLLGDASKACRELSWKPKYDWKTLLTEMIENDLKLEALDK